MSTKTISSAWTSSGDDVYVKPTDSDFSGTGTTWPTSCVTATEIAITNVYQVSVDDNKSYVVYREVGSPRSIADIVIGTIDSTDTSAIVAGVYDSLAGIQPTVSLTFDPRTMLIRLVDGDDWLEDVRTIDIPITLPSTVTDLSKCTATFGAAKGATRIDRLAEVIEIESEPHIRLTFLRATTLRKPNGRYNWDAKVQYTDAEVTSTITVYNGTLDLIKGIAKLPGEIT